MEGLNTGEAVQVGTISTTTFVFDPLHLRAGDVVLEFANDKSSRLIAKFDGGSFSHALMWVGGTDFIEATDGGSRVVSFRRIVVSDPNRWMLLRYVGAGELSEEVSLAAAREARGLSFVPYSYKGAIASITPAAKPRITELFCSQLVAEAYRRVGHEAVPGQLPHKVTPKSLETSPAFVEITMPLIEVSADAVPPDYDRGVEYASSAMYREQQTAQRVMRELAPIFSRLLPLPDGLHWPIGSWPDLEMALAYGNPSGARGLAAKVHAIFEEDGYYTLLTEEAWDKELVRAMNADESGIQGWQASLDRSRQNASVISQIAKGRPWPLWQALAHMHTIHEIKFDMILNTAQASQALRSKTRV